MPPDPLPTYDDLEAKWKDLYGTPEKFADELHRNRRAAADVVTAYDYSTYPAGPPEDDPELDEWRASYGRLDLPVTVIDWPAVYAGAAALGIALVARWVVRHGRLT